MEPSERLRAWSYRRQLLGRAGHDIGSVLSAITAVYATQPTALLSLAARMPGLLASDYAHLDADRSAVRLPAMRLSSHLVPTVDAARIVAATRRPRETMAWLWRGIGLTDEEYELVTAAILEAATEPITTTELRRRLTGQAASLIGRHPQAPTLLVRAIRSEGLLAAIAPTSVRSNAFAYVAIDAWLGAPLERVDADDALAWLAAEYLRAFGPAREEDFRWWSGSTPERARRAVSAVAAVDIGGGLLLPAGDRDAFEAVAPIPGTSVDLLPLWDMYTMGFAPDGRERLVRSEHRSRAYDGSGNGYGLVLHDGVAVAAWGLRVPGRRMEVDLDVFERPTPHLRRAIDERLAELATLFGVDDIAVVEGDLRGPGGPGGPGGPKAR